MVEVYLCQQQVYLLSDLENNKYRINARGEEITQTMQRIQKNAQKKMNPILMAMEK